MNKTLYDFLISAGHDKQFRAEFLNADLTRVTTLQDILDNPERTLRNISSLRGMGQLSVARLRQAIALHFANLHQDDWELAIDAISKGSVPESRSAQIFINFIKGWKISVEYFQLTGRFYLPTQMKIDQIIEQMEGGNHYVYVPSTFIDSLKTPAVFSAEHGKPCTSQSLPARLRAALDSFHQNKPDVKFNGFIILDSVVLEDLTQGTGRYRNLSKNDRNEQIQILVQVAEMYTERPIYVADLLKKGLSPGFVIGEGPLVQYNMGGLLEVTAPDMVRLFRERAQHIADTAPTLQEWLIHGIAAAA
jgi:hypothetical protein